MLKKRLSLHNRPTLHRAVPLVALAAVMATAVTVTPSIAGSFLSSKQAQRTYLTRKSASNLYVRKKQADHRYVTVKGSHDLFLTNESADKNFLKNKDAAKTYVAKADLPAQPLGFVASSSVDFGPKQSTTAVPVPASAISFEVPVTSLVTLTFSGEATCTAAAAGVGCPVQLLIDEQPTGETKANFALSSTGTPAALASTLTTTSVLTAGEHTASVQYAGSTNESLNFGLKNWNFVVQTFPDNS